MTNKVEVEKGLIEVLRLKARVLDAVDSNEELVSMIKNRDEFLTEVANLLFNGDQEKGQVTFEQIFDEIRRLKDFETQEVSKYSYLENEYEYPQPVPFTDREVEEAEFVEMEADEEYVDQ